jgi:hypothetical protein
MKAIVLSFDKYRAVTEHMIFRYEALWPDHPFSFRIPFQNLRGNDSAHREYVHSPIGIKQTALRLLEDVNDDEWIYWCIDDKYPITLDATRIAAIAKWVTTIQDPDISGILYCRCRNLLKPENLVDNVLVDTAGHTYLERKGYHQIFLHQFARAKVIRYFFESLPDVIPFAKLMDPLKFTFSKPANHRLFVSHDNIAVFGESTSRGMLTQNCYRSMIEHGLPVPKELPVAEKTIIIGNIAGGSHTMGR